MLFSNIERAFSGPKPYAEPSFEYLDRSNRPAAQAIRQLFEDWFYAFPEAGKVDVRSRFRSSDELQHQAAAWEIYLHALLRELGYTCEVHPTTAAEQATRPDFICRHPAGEIFYVEAAVASEDPPERQARDARLNVVLDSLNRLDTPCFYIGVNVLRVPTKSPSARRLRDKIQRWVNGLNADEVADAVEAYGHEAFPTRKTRTPTPL